MIDFKEFYNAIVAKWNEMDSWDEDKKSDGDALDIRINLKSGEILIAFERDDIESRIKEIVEFRDEMTRDDPKAENRFDELESPSPFVLLDDYFEIRMSEHSTIEFSEEFLKEMESYKVDIWKD